MIFNTETQIVGMAQQEFSQIYPASGWVEHNPDDILQSTLSVIRNALDNTGLNPRDIAAIGITNQRETTILWDKNTGEAIYNAIVWQDRRTSALCNDLKKDGLEQVVSDKTGLLLDPYFSATKIAWILDNVKDARAKAERGELAFGTVDSFLIWHLTGGKLHTTDATNASRTMLFNLETGDWDEELLRVLNIPNSILPQIKDSADDFGVVDKKYLNSEIPILGVAGDQQAATMGQACFEPGSIKSTYGTGCFAVLNTGENRVHSTNRLLSTLCYRLEGQSTYALEGSIFIAGAAVKWLRDGLKIINNASESGELALQADPQQDVILVPAFTGLGAPWWRADVRGALFGLTLNTGPAEIAHAVLESIGFQTLDLLNAMKNDWQQQDFRRIRVDGGMVASDWAMQRLSDLLAIDVERPSILETTALGAAWLAGMYCGVWPGMKGFAQKRVSEKIFTPAMSEDNRSKRIDLWKEALDRVLKETTS